MREDGGREEGGGRREEKGGRRKKVLRRGMVKKRLTTTVALTFFVLLSDAYTIHYNKARYSTLLSAKVNRNRRKSRSATSDYLNRPAVPVGKAFGNRYLETEGREIRRADTQDEVEEQVEEIISNQRAMVDGLTAVRVAVDTKLFRDDFTKDTMFLISENEFLPKDMFDQVKAEFDLLTGSLGEVFTDVVSNTTTVIDDQIQFVLETRLLSKSLSAPDYENYPTIIQTIVSTAKGMVEKLSEELSLSPTIQSNRVSSEQPPLSLPNLTEETAARLWTPDPGAAVELIIPLSDGAGTIQSEKNVLQIVRNQAILINHSARDTVDPLTKDIVGPAEFIRVFLYPKGYLEEDKNNAKFKSE